MKHYIHITEDTIFTALLVGVVLLFLLSSAITKESSGNTDRWDENWETGTGLDY